MGFTPREVDGMSIWEWLAVVEGWNKAHSPKQGNTLSDAEKEDLWAFVNDNDPQPRQRSTMTYWWDERGPVPMGVVRFSLSV